MTPKSCVLGLETATGNRHHWQWVRFDKALTLKQAEEMFKHFSRLVPTHGCRRVQIRHGRDEVVKDVDRIGARPDADGLVRVSTYAVSESGAKGTTLEPANGRLGPPPTFADQ